MSTSFVKKPRCTGNICQPPYEQFVSQAGKTFEKCMNCENLVFKDHKPKAGVPAENPGSYEKAPRCEGGCPAPYDAFTSKAGAPFEKCLTCKNLVFDAHKLKTGMDVVKQASASTSTAHTHTVALSTLVVDLGAKVDTALKSGLELQLKLQELEEKQNELIIEFHRRLTQLESSAISSASAPTIVDNGGTEAASATSNKRARK